MNQTNAVTEPSLTSAWAKAALQIRRAQVQDAVKVIQDHLKECGLEFAFITPFAVSFTEVGEISERGIIPFDPDADLTPAERANDGRGWDMLNPSREVM